MLAVIDGIAGSFRTALFMLFAAVGAVLLIACANLANLMLTRASGRRKELAVQLALGSSRANVVQQVLIEALVVGMSGGLLGVLVARIGVDALVALAPTALPRSGEIRIVTFQRALGQRLSSLPSVSQAAAISLPPSSGLLSRVPFTVEGRPIEREHVPFAQFRTVSAGYFEAARIPLKRGRTFLESDTDKTRAVAVVNEELARWLDGLEPIGARLLVDDNDGPPRPVEIIGVVGNAQQVALDEAPTWDLYLAYPQIHPDNVGAAAANMFWIVRTTADPMNLASALAKEVRRIDPEVAASQIRPLAQYLADAVAPRRFSLSLMTAFAFAALALAVTGIYAVVMYSVSQREREIAIRIALGASRSSVVWLVTGHQARFVLIGVAAGIGLALGATRLLSTVLFGLAATDAATFGQVAVVVAAVSLVACIVPTFRVRRLVGTILKAE